MPTGADIMLGPKCRGCGQTEARCAFAAGCCSGCTHDFGENIKPGPKPKPQLRRFQPPRERRHRRRMTAPAAMPERVYVLVSEECVVEAMSLLLIDIAAHRMHTEREPRGPDLWDQMVYQRADEIAHQFDLSARQIRDRRDAERTRNGV